MSNLRPPPIQITPAAIRATLGTPRPSGKADMMQFVAGTPKGAALLIERLRR